MLQARIFPSLLLDGVGVIKTIQFRDPVYVGDPINAARIFNANEVDELALLDKMATPEDRLISLEMIERISDECYMPLLVAGGIKTLEDIRKVINAGAEKAAINSYGIQNPDFIREATEAFGSSTVVVSIDAKRLPNGEYEVFTLGGTQGTGKHPKDLAIQMKELGAGELLINSIDRDGTKQGYDLELIKQVSQAVNIPVVASGGAGSLEDIAKAIHEGGVSAATAGTIFVLQGRRRAVLISFPSKEEIKSVLDTASSEL